MCVVEPAGLLQPLLIPGVVWVDISLDFIEGLPKSRGKNTILVVVDRLSKHAPFLPLSHPFTVAFVGQLYFEQIFRLHSLPRTIVSGMDKIFLSTLGGNCSLYSKLISICLLLIPLKVMGKLRLLTDAWKET